MRLHLYCIASEVSRCCGLGNWGAPLASTEYSPPRGPCSNQVTKVKIEHFDQDLLVGKSQASFFFFFFF